MIWVTKIFSHGNDVLPRAFNSEFQIWVMGIGATLRRDGDLVLRVDGQLPERPAPFLLQALREDVLPHRREDRLHTAYRYLRTHEERVAIFSTL